MAKVREVYYEISIGGKPLDNSAISLIDSISLQDNSTGSDILTINIVDPDFTFIGSKSIFVEEQSITFKGGWKDDVSLNYVGYISVVDLDFPNTGSPSLVLHCMDNTHLMNRKEKKRTWQNKKVSDVANEIFGEYGFSATVDDTEVVEETISQADKTDIVFLIELASGLEDEYLVYVEGDKAYFVKKPILGESQAELKYRQNPYDIVSFSPRIVKEQKKEEVEKSDINSKNKEVEKALADAGTPRDNQGDPVITSSNKTSGASSSKGETTSKPKERKYLGGGKWEEV